MHACTRWITRAPDNRNLDFITIQSPLSLHTDADSVVYTNAATRAKHNGPHGHIFFLAKKIAQKYLDDTSDAAQSNYLINDTS